MLFFMFDTLSWFQWLICNDAKGTT